MNNFVTQFAAAETGANRDIFSTLGLSLIHI